MDKKTIKSYPELELRDFCLIWFCSIDRNSKTEWLHVRLNFSKEIESATELRKKARKK